MAKLTLTVNIAERMALEGYKHLTTVLREECGRPEWERRLELTDVVEIMERLRDVAERAPEPK